MQRSSLGWYALVLILMARAALAKALQPIVWDKTPIGLTLTVGQERLVQFPGPITVGVPGGLAQLMRVQTVDDTVYLLAQQPFEATRVIARERDGGRTYVLDVSASTDGGQNPPVRITQAAEANAPDSAAGDANELHGVAALRIGYVTLTRFAAQQLYAPARLLEDLPGVMRVPIKPDPVALLRGDTVTATPLIAWRADNLYVTAVKLTNRLAVPLVLDPRALRGGWLAATFQHTRLAKHADESDTTVVYLISSLPFAAAL